MRTALSIPMGAALAALLLTACAKPVDKTAAAAADTTATAADSAAMNTTEAAGGAADAGGAVSPPQSPQNDAINADANKTETTQTPGSNSFTEGQARGHIEHAGYSNVTGLTKTPDGMWVGKAMKGGKTMDVSVDFKGAVTTK